ELWRDRLHPGRSGQGQALARFGPETGSIPDPGEERPGDSGAHGERIEHREVSLQEGRQGVHDQSRARNLGGLPGKELNQHRRPPRKVDTRQLVPSGGEIGRDRGQIDQVVERFAGEGREIRLAARLPEPAPGEIEPDPLGSGPGARREAVPEMGRLGTQLAEARRHGASRTRPRTASARSTYLARTSTSRWTRSPGARLPSVVASNVCGMSATSKLSDPRAETVRLTPSTVTEPFSTR